MTIAWAIIIAAGILGICLILGIGLAVRIFLDALEIDENKDGYLDINFSYKRTPLTEKTS